MVNKYTWLEIAEQLSVGGWHLFNRVSFEARSISVAKAISGSLWRSHTTCVSKNCSKTAQVNLGDLQDYFGGEMAFIEIDTSDPLQVAGILKGAIDDFSSRAGKEAAVIDITSFRREELLMLLAMLSMLPPDITTNWSLAYVGAKDMGEWLSGKVTSIRSVFGYPGDVWPSKSTRLIVLMGFEIGRARTIIETYEPAEILLGMGRKSDFISEELYTRNKKLVDELALELKVNVQQRFEFSARDPLIVASELESVIQDAQRSNIVIAPLHTKLSTVGVGLYALKYPAVQICYAAVEEYNEEVYSAPGSHVYMVPLG